MWWFNVKNKISKAEKGKSMRKVKYLININKRQNKDKKIENKN